MLSRAHLFTRAIGPHLPSTAARAFITGAQMAENQAALSGLPIRIQERSQCDKNAIGFLRAVFPDRPIASIPFTNNYPAIRRLLENGGMLAFLADGISQQPTSNTAASLYRSGMHAVVIVGEIVQGGVPHFLIFDGDDSVCNVHTDALHALARSRNKEPSQLTPAEIWESGAAAGLFRIEPAATFLQRAKQSETTADPHGIPYTIRVNHYAATPDASAPCPEAAPAKTIDTYWHAIARMSGSARRKGSATLRTTTTHSV